MTEIDPSVFGLYTLRSVISRFIESNVYEDQTEIEGLLRYLQHYFSKDKLIFSLEKEKLSRQQIIENKEINNEDKEGIITLSDRLELNEMECSRYWFQAKNVLHVKQLEIFLGENIFGLNTMGIAEHFYLLECKCLIDSIHYLFRSRSDEHLDALKKRTIHIITNRLLLGNIASKLMNIVADFAEVLGKRDRPQEKKMIVEKFLPQIVECLFFVFYETQTSDEEARQLLLTIKCLSVYLGEYINQPQSWQIPLFGSLVGLQMTQIRALNQFALLYDRSENQPPFGKVNTGNKVRQVKGCKEGLDDVWPSPLINGFSCLVYALFRQPEYEDSNGAIEFSDMAWFLHRASVQRAFSYIRIGVIPFLQSQFFEAKIRHYFMSTLAEFLFNVSRLFTENSDSQFFEYNDIFPFFLISRAQFQEDSLFVENNLNNKILNPELGMVDCFDDVIELFGVMGDAFPDFASYFWNDQMKHVPFVIKVVNSMERSLFVPILQFLCGISGGGRNKHAAKSTFFFVDRKMDISWKLMFEKIDQHARELGSELDLSFSNKTLTGNQQSDLTESIERNHRLLLAVMKLISCTIQDQQAAIRMSEFDPIRRLFLLLIMRIKPELKGAIFHAISSLVSQNGAYVDDVWIQIEHYGLLPAINNSTGMNLRQNLEIVESEMGKYPTTDGFLALLGSLLQYGAPETLGYGLRRPGILIYLEYVLNEIIVKAPDRYYSGDSEDAERLRLIARAFHIFSTVLEKYPINEVYSSIVSPNIENEILNKYAIPEPLKKCIEFDFTQKSETEEYHYDIQLPNQIQPQKEFWVKPKCAGFVVMFWILSDSKLVDSIYSILSENYSTKGKGIFHNPFDYDSLYVSLDIISNTRSKSNNASQIGKNLHFYGWDYICPSYWQKAAVSSALGLLYNCSIRESSFIELVYNAKCTLHILTSNDLRPSKQPVIIQSLPKILIHQRTNELSPISLICHFVRSSLDNAEIALSITALSLLKHIASNLNADTFLDAFSIDNIGLKNLRLRCTEVLRDSSTLIPISIDNSLTVVSQGADIVIDSYLNERKFLDDHLPNTISEAVLELILYTLHPKTLGLSHFLLGFEDIIHNQLIFQNPKDYSHPLQFSHILPDPSLNTPNNCFDAILHLITSQQSENEFSSIVYTSPNIANKCFEIMYRLTSAPITSKIVLALLRKKFINFFPRQFKACFYRIDQIHQEISTIDGYTQDSISNEYINYDLMYQLADVEQCLAWVIKIGAIELYHLSEFDLIKENEFIIQLFSTNNFLDHSPSINTPPIVQVLKWIHFTPLSFVPTKFINYPHQMKKQITECFNICKRPYNIPDALYAFYSSPEMPSPIGGYFQIEIPQIDGYFSNLINDVSDTSFCKEIAIEYNYLQQRAASSSHISQAVRQLLSIAFLTQHDTFFGSFDDIRPNFDNQTKLLSDADERLREFTNSFISPFLDILNKNPDADMLIAEQIVMIYIPLVNAIGNASKYASLSVEQYELILKFIIFALLRRDYESIGSYRLGKSKNSTEFFRGNLYVALAHMLRYGCSSTFNDGYRSVRMTVLEPIIVPLVDCICSDLVSPKGSVAEIWLIAGTSLLSLLLTSLGPYSRSVKLINPFEDPSSDENFRSTLGSHAYLQALQILTSQPNNYIKSIVSSLNFSILDNKNRLFNSTLALFCSISSSSEGTQALLETDIIDNLMNFDKFLPTFNTIGSLENNYAEHESILMMLRFLRSIAIIRPISYVIELCTKFINYYYAILSRYIKLISAGKSTTLEDLKLVEAFIALFSVIASKDNNPNKKNPDNFLSLKNDVSKDLGKYSEKIIDDSLELFYSMSSSLFPKYLGKGPSVSIDPWWKGIQPSTALESVQSQTILSQPRIFTFMGYPETNWSVFDKNLLEIELRILSNISLVLRERITSSPKIDSLNTISVFDFSMISKIFCNCTFIVLRYQSMEKSFSPNGDKFDTNQGNDEFYEDAVEKTLLYVCENLIFVLHHIIFSLDLNGLISYKKEIDHIFQQAQSFPPRSLVWTTFRWIKERVDNISRL